MEKTLEIVQKHVRYDLPKLEIRMFWKPKGKILIQRISEASDPGNKKNCIYNDQMLDRLGHSTHTSKFRFNFINTYGCIDYFIEGTQFWFFARKKVIDQNRKFFLLQGRSVLYGQ